MVACTEDGRVARISGSISTHTIGLVVVLNSAIRVAVRGRLVGRVPLVLAVSPFPPLFAIRLFTVKSHLIVLRLSALPQPFGPMPLLLRLQDGVVWQKVSDAPAELAPHATVGVPGCLHGDTAACNRLGVGKVRKLSTNMVCTMCQMFTSPKSCCS